MKIHTRIENGKLKETDALITFLEVNNDKDVEIKTIKDTRTYTQNNALHLFLTQLAETLNEGGFTVQMILKEKVDLDWDMEKIKELLWRPAQWAILGRKSTTELSKQEDIDMVYKHLTRHLGEKFGIEVPRFPSKTSCCKSIECICGKEQYN